MARNRIDDDQQHCLLSFLPEVDEDEEALSLCDLPDDELEETQESSLDPENDIDIDFGFDSGIVFPSQHGSVSMCSADELFSKGRILPLRHSISSETGLTRRACTRSESLDRNLTCGSHLGGCGGGDYKSCNSLNASTKPKLRNNFMYTLPSPQPQVRRSRSLRTPMGGTRNHKLSVWDILKLGLVRAPEIELHDIKFRNLHSTSWGPVSRNSSCSSSTSDSSGKIVKADGNRERGGRKKTAERSTASENGKRGFLFNRCKCSVDIAETTTLTAPLPTTKADKRDCWRQQQYRTKTASKCSKQAMSRNRTVEWVKELSQGSFVNHGA